MWMYETNGICALLSLAGTGFLGLCALLIIWQTIVDIIEWF